jgi:hypothetical protein
MLKEPSKAKLAKYGMSPWHFWNLASSFFNRCHICLVVKDRLFIDHKHVKGFSRMQPVEKRKHVRGLLCYFCNRFRVCKNTLDSARQVVAYLERHERTITEAG